jgi:hypothetical protein
VLLFLHAIILELLYIVSFTFIQKALPNQIHYPKFWVIVDDLIFTHLIVLSMTIMPLEVIIKVLSPQL